MRGEAVRLLLVDDDPHIRKALGQYLEMEGYGVRAVAGALEGLAALRERPPAVVLLDLMMPGMDGFDFLRALRAEPGLGGLPVILLSARGHDLDVYLGARLGVSGYLVKPFPPEELVGAIEEVLRGGAGNPPVQP